MEKESLDKAQKILTNAIKNSDIDTVDRLELLLNIYYFLEYQDYEENIKLLRGQKYGQSEGTKTFNIFGNETNKRM